jgi:hypothetical protein
VAGIGGSAKTLIPQAGTRTRRVSRPSSYEPVLGFRTRKVYLLLPVRKEQARQHDREVCTNPHIQVRTLLDFGHEDRILMLRSKFVLYIS